MKKEQPRFGTGRSDHEERNNILLTHPDLCFTGGPAFPHLILMCDKQFLPESFGIRYLKPVKAHPKMFPNAVI